MNEHFKTWNVRKGNVRNIWSGYKVYYRLGTIISSWWFCFAILWWSQRGHHPQVNLAKFVYKPDNMKLFKNKVPWTILYILGYLLKSIIKCWQLGFLFPSKKSGEIGSFLPWKILWRHGNQIFQVKKKGKISPQKITPDMTLAWYIISRCTNY